MVAKPTFWRDFGYAFKEDSLVDHPINDGPTLYSAGH